MNTRTELPAWRILPAPDNQFSWSRTDGDDGSQSAQHRRVIISRGGIPESPRIPSMSDLLVEGK